MTIDFPSPTLLITKQKYLCCSRTSANLWTCLLQTGAVSLVSHLGMFSHPAEKGWKSWKVCNRPRAARARAVPSIQPTEEQGVFDIFCPVLSSGSAVQSGILMDLRSLAALLMKVVFPADGPLRSTGLPTPRS